MRSPLFLTLALTFFLAAPAYAQDRSDHGSHDPAHDMHMPDGHSSMDMGTPSESPATDAGMDMDTMTDNRTHQGAENHGFMDHGMMDHMNMDSPAPVPAGEIPQSPPPPAAFAGPAFAADQHVGADVMAASRAHVVHEVSGMPVFWFQADRLEFRAHKGRDGYLWDVQGYYGGPTNRFWFKSEGEGSFGEKPESAEVQALWSHAIGPWFDLQAGVRQDLAGPTRTHAVIGVQGLAPYMFEVDAAAFISNKGDVTARIEAELDQRITQRLILQPRVELDLAAQDIPELAIGGGLDRVEVGLRLRYEFAREFAPYVGVEQEWKVGQSADYARTLGDSSSVTSFVAGVRFWF